MRVDDGDNERIYQEARAQDRKLQELDGERRSTEGTAFDKAMAGRAQVQQKSQLNQQTKQGFAKSVLQRAISTGKDSKGGNKGSKATKAGVAPEAERAHEGAAHLLAEGTLQADRGTQDRSVQSRSTQARSGDTQQAAGQQARTQGQVKQKDGELTARKTDAAESGSTEGRRAEEAHQQDEASATARSSGRVGGARGQKDEGQGQGQGGEQKTPETFRLPPAALMAPPPLARPKDTGPPSRLRQLAQEIADKIVKHVHVGTNRQGLPEFQLELRSDILKGLKVKVSGRHGRIRATFSSRDPGVVKQLKGEVARLREALTARGLKVDGLDVIEERA